MYVASLNLDLFFKKVFSNKRIAKKFLEDVLNVQISDIKILSTDYRISDDAVIVKFDFRCKIQGKYIVIEMQQRYKIDVIKRFYLYHAVSTALQLETLKPITVTKLNGETYTEKNYSGLKPVVTLIWMVDDVLGFEEDYIAFTTLPEAAKDFITNTELWEKPLESILAERKKALIILENDTKGLDFFTQNRLIYIFQKNIVKNKHKSLPYFKWFDFANMSRNLDNKEEDFLKFKEDKDMAEVINRLRKDKLPPDEFKYVSDLQSYEILLKRLDLDYKAKMKRQEKALLKQQEQHKQKVEQQEQKVEQEKQKVEQEKQKVEMLQNRLLKSIKMLLEQGGTLATISEALDISLEETTELVQLIQNNN